MHKEKRKATRLRVQCSPEIPALRLRFAEAMNKLPALSERFHDKAATLARCFLGGKMPKRVVIMQRGHYGVRPCVAGVVFTALVISAVGGRENAKLAAPLSRLADAIAYHFRNSRMRGKLEYNFDIEQAKADAALMRDELEALSKLLSSCGVIVMGNPISEIEFAKMPYPSAEKNDWEIQILGLTKRVCELENTITLAQDLYERLERIEKIANSQQKAIEVILERLDINVTHREELEKRVKVNFSWASNALKAGNSQCARTAALSRDNSTDHFVTPSKT